MLVIGLISGTSADGVDAALCEITGAPPALRAEVRHALTLPYAEDVQRRALELARIETGRVDQLAEMHFELGEVFAEAARRAAEAAGIPLAAVDLIGSHGQTFWHAVRSDGTVAATLQLGEPAVIAEQTGVTTIANFRARDVAAGGQGAPLAGYLDWLLLRHPHHWRAAQNIGGIGNVTFLPPLEDTSSAPLAFDTGPGNALMDDLIALISDGQRRYDAGGALAAQGQPNAELLAELMAHPYLRRPPPKTTGRELFSKAMARELLEKSHARGMGSADLLATAAAFTAESIAAAYRDFAPAPIAEVLVSGGGVHNRTLMEMLRRALGDIPVQPLEAVGLNSDHKEALLFAVLAYETWHGRAGTLPEFTGARRPTVLGQIVPGENYMALIRRTWGRKDNEC